MRVDPETIDRRLAGNTLEQNIALARSRARWHMRQACIHAAWIVVLLAAFVFSASSAAGYLFAAAVIIWLEIALLRAVRAALALKAVGDLGQGAIDFCALLADQNKRATRAAFALMPVAGRA
jgi:hypothetical protein